MTAPVTAEEKQEQGKELEMQTEKSVEIIRLSDIALQKVEWLWYPYIPFSKVTIVQGDPGEGKTTLALRLAAACSNGTALPGMERQSPFCVIYQTAEDGLADTVKPRLIEAGADETRILNINEDKHSLTFLDERIEKAITQAGAKLLILDPIQGYLGDRMDMNRANETREVMKSIANVAQRTGCAIVLVGHLNKAQGSSSAYRGLGSIDFRAAARSVLIVGRLKKEPNTRVVVHDKSSLAPEGKSLAFHLGDEDGFYWLNGYEDITADDLLSGGNEYRETKTGQAEELIREMLSDGKEIPCEEIFKAAEQKGISRRTVNEAKKQIPELRTRKVSINWAWSLKQ